MKDIFNQLIIKQTNKQKQKQKQKQNISLTFKHQ